MIALDKIYIRIERTYGASDGQVIAMVTPHNERQSVNDIEYIRKDALIEWLENKIKTPDVGFINGLTYLAYKDVIEHLNEM